MRHLLLAAALAAAVAALAAARLLGPGPDSRAQEPLTLAVDADTAGNDSTTAGQVQSCLRVEQGDTFDVDVLIMNVQDLIGWESLFRYKPGILEVTKANVAFFQAANANSSVINASDPVPDTDGLFFLGAADVNQAVDSGSGVLARLTLHAVGAGLSSAELPSVDFNGDGAPDRGPKLSTLAFGVIQHPGDENGDQIFDGPTYHAQIAVGEPCPITPPPPTLPESATPTPGLDETPGGDQTPGAGGSPTAQATAIVSATPVSGPGNDGPAGDGGPGGLVQSGGGSGVPLWMIGPILGAAVVLAAGMFGIWRALKQT